MDTFITNLSQNHTISPPFRRCSDSCSVEYFAASNHDETRGENVNSITQTVDASRVFEHAVPIVCCMT